MPWKEFTVDNNKDCKGDGRRRDRAYIMIFKGISFTFRITARYHDGHFKWYLDCDDAKIYEQWIGVASVESRKSIKRVANRILMGHASSIRNIHAIVDLNTAEKEGEEMDQKRA